MASRSRDPQSLLSNGFSFVETVVALVLAGILLAIVVPSSVAYVSNQRALAAARTLASDLKVAQQEAVTRRAVVDVVFAGADDLCAGAASYTVRAQADGAVVKRFCFERDVGWLSVPQPVTFETLGVPAAGTVTTHLQIQSLRTGRTYTVILEGQTGAVTCRPDEEVRCGG